MSIADFNDRRNLIACMFGWHAYWVSKKLTFCISPFYYYYYFWWYHTLSWKLCSVTFIVINSSWCRTFTLNFEMSGNIYKELVWHINCRRVSKIVFYTNDMDLVNSTPFLWKIGFLCIFRVIFQRVSTMGYPVGCFGCQNTPLDGYFLQFARILKK